MRSVDFYFYEGTPNFRELWLPGDSEPGPCVYALINSIGLEAASAWADRHPAVGVRALYGGEGELDINTCGPKLKWSAYKALLRQRASDGRVVLVGKTPFAYRELVRKRKSILIYQDVIVPDGSTPNVSFLEHQVPIATGAVRLARHAKLPMRVLSIEPTPDGWLARVGPRFEPSDAELLNRMQAEVRRRPECWAMWDSFLEYIDSQPSK